MPQCCAEPLRSMNSGKENLQRKILKACWLESLGVGLVLPVDNPRKRCLNVQKVRQQAFSCLGILLVEMCGHIFQYTKIPVNFKVWKCILYTRKLLAYMTLDLALLCCQKG